MSDQINNIYENFNLYAKNLLNSNHTSFFANLNTFKDFCDNTLEIKEILEPIKQCPFNGLKYFTDNQENSFSIEEPKNNLDLLKIAYDTLWSDINILQIHMYATFGLGSRINNFDCSLRLFNSQITNLFIAHIKTNLKKVNDNSNIPAQVTHYQIGEVHDSIIGNQTNASMTNNNNSDSLSKSKFELFCEKHKHKIFIILGILAILVPIIILLCQPSPTP